MKTLIVCISLLGVFFANRAGAWPTTYFSDDVVVGRAEAIVLARVKEGSITKIARDGKYEHRAVLTVSRIIKGDLQETEIPVAIHYGLLPVAVSSERYMALQRSVPEVTGEAVKIHEDNPSEGFFRSSGDIHLNQIWLLRHHRYPSSRDHYDGGENTDFCGIWDPEDLQPPASEQKLIKYLRSK